MKYIFLHTHHGAPYKQVLESLSVVPGIHVCRSETTYEHPTDLIRLRERDKWAVTFVDTILENKEVQSKSVEEEVLNIFLLGGECENENYLRFRLRRMYEIWRRNNGIVLNHNWNELEELFNRKINKVEVNTSNPIVGKYLPKFVLHKVWPPKSTQT